MYKESHTHGLILVQIKETGHILFTQNEAKYNYNNGVMKKELRRILHEQDNEQFFKG